MEMPSRYIYKRYQIDTNRINARQKLETMNKLEKWADDGVIDIQMSEVAMYESSSGGSSQRSQKAMGHIFSYTASTTPQETDRMREIESIIFPEGCKDQNQRNDVEIVFNAGKYVMTLITEDGASKKQSGGILDAQSELQKIGIRVLRDTEAIAEIEQSIRDRDQMAQRINEEYDHDLPDWVNRD